MTPSATQPVVTCAACGKQFRPRPELAGKRAKCPCGAVLHIPKSAEPQPPAEGDADFDFAPEPPAPTGPAAAPAAEDPAAVMARLGRSPAELRRSTPLCGDPDAAADDDDAFRPSTLRDFIIPALLIAAGVALRFAEALHGTDQPAANLAAAVPGVLMRIGLSVALMLGGMFLAVQVMEVCFIGPLGRTVFKLLAIAVAPGAVYGLLSHTIGDVAGSTAGTFASVAIYGVLFLALMRLDLKDVSICVIVTWILVTAANYAAYRAEGLIRDAWV
jgi:hypothetical protein